MGNSQFLITTVIAIYGASIATISMAASVWLGVLELKKKRPRISIVVGERILFSESIGASEPVMLAQAINVGLGSQKIVSVQLQLSNKTPLTFLDFYKLKLPFEIDENRSCDFIIPCRLLKGIESDHKAKIVAIHFVDAAGRYWKKKLPENLHQKLIQAEEIGWKIE